MLNLREFPTPVILDQARERGLCAGKSAIGFQKLIVSCLIRSFRAERRARIDRGDRDLESEPDRGRIRHDLGKCDLTPLWGENAPRARLITLPRVHFGARSLDEGSRRRSTHTGRRGWGSRSRGGEGEEHRGLGQRGAGGQQRKRAETAAPYT